MVNRHRGFRAAPIRYNQEKKRKNKLRASRKWIKQRHGTYWRAVTRSVVSEDFPRVMSRNGTPSRADSDSLRSHPAKHIACKELGFPHCGHSHAFYSLSSTVRRPESFGGWHWPPALIPCRVSPPKGMSTNYPARTPYGRRDSILMETRRPILLEFRRGSSQ